MTLDDILADFELLDDWEDRYRYVIELGRGLEPLPDGARTPANKVQGCVSQVWLSTSLAKNGSGSGGGSVAARSLATRVVAFVTHVVALRTQKNADKFGAAPTGAGDQCPLAGHDIDYSANRTQAVHGSNHDSAHLVHFTKRNTAT